jgi:hypothetical protein
MESGAPYPTLATPLQLPQDVPGRRGMANGLNAPELLFGLTWIYREGLFGSFTPSVTFSGNAVSCAPARPHRNLDMV